MAIQIKRGNEADLQIDRLQPGEPVAALDTGKSGVRGGSGMLWNATAGGGAYQAVLASEKGAANGVMALPTALPTTGSILKMASGGTVESAENSATLSASLTGYLDTTIHLDKIGKIVVCSIEPVNGKSWTGTLSFSALIPEGFRPVRQEIYTKAVEISTGATLTFTFNTNGNVDITFPTASNYEYIRFGTFVWITN